MALAPKLLLPPIIALLGFSGVAVDAAPAEQQVQSQRDGQHDFDWEFGTWRTKVRVLRNPLSGMQPNWAEYKGTSTVRPILGGRFNLIELSVAGPSGKIEGASLRLYQQQTHLWTLNYANARDGLLTSPVEGGFDEPGRGIFLADDALNGRPIKVRFVITASSRTAHFEQYFSPDGGSTWELNWVADDTRLVAAR